VSRQLGIEGKDLYTVRDNLLKKSLGFTDDEVIPLIIYQHLRNSVHNKGLHFNPKYPHVKYKLNKYKYEFKHDEKFYFDWYMLGELLLEINKILWKIVNHEKIKQIATVTDKNFIVRYDDEE
jgi:hypothetical protein